VVIKHKDVAGTRTLKNAARLCQLWNVRHLILKKAELQKEGM